MSFDTKEVKELINGAWRFFIILGSSGGLKIVLSTKLPDYQWILLTGQGHW